MKVIVIIPARYASTRFPGKPLALINGKPMIQHTFDRALKARKINNVYIATDDDRIAKAASMFTDNVILTSTKHRSGTERCAEALEKIRAGKITGVINVQGDEPFIKPAQIDKVADLLSQEGVDIATLAVKIKDYSDLADSNKVKLVLDNDGNAMYFSRSAIPFVRDAPIKDWLQHATYYKHIGIYGFKAGVLKACVRLRQSSLEKAENLEQLRWLQNGYRINVGITTAETIGIDTPEDLLRIKL